MLEDRLLILGMKKGDVQAFSRLYEKYKDDLLTLAVLLIGDKLIAEDILYDCFISFLRNIQNFHIQNSLKNYLVVSFVSCARNYFRSAGEKQIDVDDIRLVDLKSFGPLRQARQREQQEFIEQSLANIAHQEREIIILHLQGNFTFKQIASQQACSIDIISEKYRQAIEKLKSARLKFSEIENLIKSLRRTPSEEVNERILTEGYRLMKSDITKESTAGKSSRPYWKWLVIAILALAAILLFVYERPRPAFEEKEVLQADTQIQQEAEPKSKLQIVDKMLADKDTNGLLEMLLDDDISVQTKAADCLAEIGGVFELEFLRTMMPDWKGAKEENPFAAAVDKLTKKVGVKANQTSPKKPESRSAVTEEEQNYIQGWLIDSNDNPVVGRVTIGFNQMKTDDGGGFTLIEPVRKEFMSIFGSAFDSENKIGCLFVYKSPADGNDIEIILQPLADVRGVVVDGNDVAVTDFTVELKPFVNDEAAYQGDIGEVSWQTKFGSNGSFEIAGIPPGHRLQLVIKRSGFSTLIALDDLSAGESFDLGRIELERLDGFNEKVGWNCCLAGFVFDEANEPLGGAVIAAAVGEEHFETAADSEGWYELCDLPLGIEVQMVVFSLGYGHNLFVYNCNEPNINLDLQIFPPAFDWFDKPAPPLAVSKWLNTEPITLDDLTGSVVLLWVGLDCTRQSAQIVEQVKDVHQKYSGSGLEVIAVHKYSDGSISEEQIQKFIADNGIDFAVAIDDESQVVRRLIPPTERFYSKHRIAVSRRALQFSGATYSLYEVKHDPAFYLIDKDSFLRTAATPRNLEEQIKQLLSE